MSVHYKWGTVEFVLFRPFWFTIHPAAVNWAGDRYSYLLHGWYPNDRCAYLLHGWYPSDRCAYLLHGWYPSDRCACLLHGWNPSDRCAYLLHGWYPSDRCAYLLHGWYPKDRCTYLLHGWYPKDRCTYLLHGWYPKDRCTYLLHRWYPNDRIAQCADSQSSCSYIYPRTHFLIFVSLTHWTLVSEFVLETFVPWPQDVHWNKHCCIGAQYLVYLFRHETRITWTFQICC